MIPSDDRGLTLGDGLFETVLWEDGRLHLWAEHYARLARGCAALGLRAPDAGQALSAMLDAARALNGVRGAVRLTWSAGSGGRGLDRPEPVLPRMVVTAAAATAPTAPARLVTASTRRNEGSLASRLKTLSYLDSVLARREALAAGADEAVMLNNRGEVACAAAANLFWMRDGVLHTPALDCGVLDGLIRARMIERYDAREVRAGLDALRAADALYLTNSLIGVRPVGGLDGRPVPLGPRLDV